MGQIDAIAIFRASGKLAPEAYDFPKILATPGVDFLRPWGQNYYPGVAVDNDRSVVEPTRTAAPQATDTSNPVPLDPVPLDPVPLDPGTDSESDEEQIEQAQETEDPEPITLLDIIDDEPEPLDLAPGPGIRLNNYVADENGKPIHKASICRLVLNKEFVAKSKNRTDRAAGLGLGRVRCFTKVESRSLKAAGSGNMTGPAFITGDMFLTLVQHGKRVSMAILKSTTILQDGRVVRDIAAATIANVQANVKLTGQIVHLEAVKTTPDDIVEGGNSNAPALEESWTWLCTGTFLTRTSKMKATGILTTKPVVLTVPGVLVELVNPPVVDAQGRLSEQAAKGLNSAGTTWALHHPPLCFLLAQLSQRLNEASTVLRAVPKVNESSHFPYKSASGTVIEHRVKFFYD